MTRIAQEITVPGGDVVRMVLMKLSQDRGLLRKVGKEFAADLRSLAEAGHVSVRLVIPEGDELSDDNDFGLTFSYDVTQEQYEEATGALLCVDCGAFSVFTKELERGEVCDYCRAREQYGKN